MHKCIGVFDVKYYKDNHGDIPFLRWLETLDDGVARAKIKVRIDRLGKGNFGDWRSLGSGIHELKIHFGPGYRVYFGFLTQEIVVLLVGGSKRTQVRDIDKAKECWTSLGENRR